MTYLQPTNQDDLTIYRHDGQPGWGHAIMAWERGHKRGYQFEDGKLRVFKEGWYEHLREVDQPLPRAIATAKLLWHKLGVTARQAELADPGISFDDQLLLFSHLYPDGFRGRAWRSERRGDGAKRRLKRHRDAAIADAREVLSAERLDMWIERGEFAAAWDAIRGLLARTDLVTGAQTRPLDRIGDEARKRLVTRVRGLLWGDEGYQIRFERFIAALALATGKQPSWQLATALSALVNPGEHVFVRPTEVRAQAAWMAPRLSWSNTPSASLYGRVQSMAQSVMAELNNADLGPADMLDVHDFLWTTLRAKAREQLDALKSGDTPAERATA